MTDPLDRIEAVATAADDHGRPWEWEHAYPQRVTRVGDVVLVAECFEDPDEPSRFAEFIATCDPSTVLALIAVARAARNYQRYFAHDTLRGTHHALQCELAAALARLDTERE